MNRTPTLFAVALILATGLWLATFMSISGRVPVIVALPERVQQGVHTITFINDLSPPGYNGTADTYMDYYAQGANKGGNLDFWVTSDDKKRTLIRFDLSQHIPHGARVLSATLTIHVNSRTQSYRMGLLCYQVLQPWVENEATWRETQENVPWWGEGCSGSSRSESPVCQIEVNKSSGDVDLNLPVDLLQAWVDNPAANFGVLFQGELRTGTVIYKFASSENGTREYRPRLVVVYEGEPPLATPTPTQTPTKTPTPPNPTIITSTLSDWKIDVCMKVPKSPPDVQVAGPEQMILIWEGTPYTAKLRMTVCNTNAGYPHSVYLNGVLVGYTPLEGTGNCECNYGPQPPPVEWEIDPSIVIPGSNYITVTNSGDPYDGYKASRAHIVMIGNITGTTRLYFDIGQDSDGSLLQGGLQVPIGYAPAVARPLLISVPGYREDKDDGLNRYAVRANDQGWLLASLDLRKVRWTSFTWLQYAKSPSLAVQHDIMCLLQYMQEHYNVDRSRTYIAGFSVGGGIAATMAAKYPDVFAAVVDYAGPTDYAEWYAERRDIDWSGEFTGGDFDYKRRSSQTLARNLRYVPMRIVHGKNDIKVQFHHSQELYDQLYDPANTHKFLIPHDEPGDHTDWVPGVSETDLQFLSQYTLTQDVQDLSIVTDEGKDYYWLHVAKMGVADDAWRGFVEVYARYDPNTNTIWVTAGDGGFAEGKPLTVTLDLAKMHLDAASPYDIEEYDAQTGDFFLHPAILPKAGKLAFTVPRNNLGAVRREYVIYPASGIELGHALLQQDHAGYAGAKDTYITNMSYENPDTPHGAATTLLLGYDWRRKALLKFDLGPVPDCVLIKGAKLTLHLAQNRSTGINVSAYEILRPWVDSEATWKLVSQGQPWATPGAEGVGSDRADMAEYMVQNIKLAGPYSFNLKSLVQRWFAAPSSNYGLVLIGSGPYTSASYPLASAEYSDASKRPLLEIWYMEPGPTPTASPTNTATPQSTPTFTATPTKTSTAVLTATPTATASPTHTSTSMPTSTTTRTSTPTLGAWYIYLPLILK